MYITNHIIKIQLNNDMNTTSSIGTKLTPKINCSTLELYYK